MLKKAFTLAELSLIFFIMALLAILFYRTLRPDNVIYNNLYYSAYTQLSSAFFEVLSEEDFSLDNFTPSFFKKVNTIGESGGSANHHDAIIRYDEANAKYDIPNLFQNNFAVLMNNMLISFDIINYDNDYNQTMIATVDINGDNPPNEYNKDIIQFEINKNGVLPIGDIETNVDMLRFNLLSKFDHIQRGTTRIITGDPKVVVDNVSYDVAACSGNLPRHTFFENEPDGRRGCPAGITLNDKCDVTDAAANITLKCEVEAIKP